MSLSLKYDSISRLDKTPRVNVTTKINPTYVKPIFRRMLFILFLSHPVPYPLYSLNEVRETPQSFSHFADVDIHRAIDNIHVSSPDCVEQCFPCHNLILM